MLLSIDEAAARLGKSARQIGALALGEGMAELVGRDSGLGGRLAQFLVAELGHDRPQRSRR